MTQKAINSDSIHYIDFSMLARVLTARWRIVLFFALIGLAFGGGASVLLVDQYEAEMIVAPSDRLTGASLSGDIGRLSALAGVSLDAGGDEAAIAIEVMQSHSFLSDFILRQGIEVALFASKGWDRPSRQLVIDSGVYDEDAMEWVRDFDPSRGEKAMPNSWELYEEMSSRLMVSRDQASGLVHLSFRFYSPDLAAAWLNELVKQLNQEMRMKAKQKATRSISFLESKVEATSVSDLRVALFNLIEEQTKELMVAEVSEEYAFEVLEPAIEPFEPKGPNRLLIVCISVFLSALVGFCLSLYSFVRADQL